MLVKIEDIKVRRRVRKDLGDVNQLKESLRNYGLLNPVTLNSNYELVAGQRRLEAAKMLGWERINAVVIDSTVGKVDQLEMELEENNQRKDFTDEELLEGYRRLERLKNPPFWLKIANFFSNIFSALIKKLSSLFSPRPKVVKKKGDKSTKKR